eukprot:2247655-Lingulodinium_polyedra.AAC.1
MPETILIGREGPTARATMPELSFLREQKSAFGTRGVSEGVAPAPAQSPLKPPGCSAWNPH